MAIMSVKRMTIIEWVAVGAIIFIVVSIGAASRAIYLWSLNNYCSTYGPPVTRTYYTKIGDVMIPQTTTTTPCIEWRDKETDKITGR